MISQGFVFFLLDVNVLVVMLQEIKFSPARSCSIMSTEDLKAYGETHRYMNDIPKIIHYVYRGNYIPHQYSPHVQQCMQINKEANFVFWSDFSAYRFMIMLKQKYLQVYSSYFKKVAVSLKRSDVIRYFILLEFGGVYMDLDTKCLKPFESVFVNDSCILSRENEEQSQILYNVEYLAMNSLMACVPGHQLFQYLVDNVQPADDSWVVGQTGPVFLTKKYEEYTKKNTLLDLKHPLYHVTIADSYTFSPHVTKNYYHRCAGNVQGKWRILGCKNLPRRPEIQRIRQNESVAAHLYMHLGYSDQRHQISNLDHICHITMDSKVIWT